MNYLLEASRSTPHRISCVCLTVPEASGSSCIIVLTITMRSGNVCPLVEALTVPAAILRA